MFIVNFINVRAMKTLSDTIIQHTSFCYDLIFIVRI